MRPRSRTPRAASSRPTTGFLRSLMADRGGATALMVAVTMIPLLGAVGLALDAARGYLAHSRLVKALDMAALAAGRVALDPDAEDVAQRYFEANFGPGGEAVDVGFELDSTFRFVTLTAEIDEPTSFMRVFGVETMALGARVQVERRTTGLELALVMDNTGSMWGSAFTAMQDAAEELVEIIYGDETEIENLWISVVPYTATVNVGSDRTAWLQPTDRAVTNPGSFSTQGWRGCVMAQPSPRDANDDPPSVALLSSYFYASTTRTQDNSWPPLVTSIADENRGNSSNRNTARGPNLGCGSPITALTSRRSEVEAAIAAMGPIHRGGTAGNLGLTWGWRTISPRWRGLWGGSTPSGHPLEYGTPFMEKVVVILTDGNNAFHDQDTGALPRSDYTAYGRLEDLGVTSLAEGRTILDTRMAGTCTAMKAAGIRIYSIIFGAAPDAAAQTLFRNCATTPAMYFYAPNNATLATAFRSIGGQLANLRISQ